VTVIIVEMAILQAMSAVVSVLTNLSRIAMGTCTTVGTVVHVTSRAACAVATPYIFLATQATRIFQTCRRLWNWAISAADEMVDKLVIIPVISAMCLFVLGIYLWYIW
jgi:hypothetical protein